MTGEYDILVSVCGFILIAIFCLIIMWAENLKDEGEDDAARTQLCDLQDKDIDLDGEPHARYTIYEDGKIAFSTHNAKLAKDAYEAICQYGDSEVELHEGDKILSTNKNLRK